MKMKKMAGFAAAAMMCSAFMAGCTAKSAASKGNQAGDTIKIGVNMELSGAAAGYGQQEKNGIELAVQEINAKGGVNVNGKKKKIKAIYRDNKSSTSTSASVAAQLTSQDKAVALIGPATTNAGTATIPTANKANVPFLSASATAPDFTLDKKGKVQPYVFRACFKDDYQGITAAKFAYDTLKAKKVAILADNSSDYGTGITKAFKKVFKGQVVATQYFQAGDKDFNSILTSIKSKNFDALDIPAYYTECGTIIKQAREAGIKQPILGADGMSDDKMIKIAGNANSSDIYYTTPFTALSAATNPLVSKFNKAYKAKFGEDAPTFAALAYDSVYMVKKAVETEKSADSVKIQAGLAKLKNFKGVTGNTTMDAKHNPQKSITIVKLENGKSVKGYVVK